MVKTFLYSLESCTDLSDSIASNCEQHFLDYGKVAKGRSPLNEQLFLKTALRIFLILCMKVSYYKGQKLTRPFFRKNSGSLIIHENVLKNGLFWGFLTLSQFWWKSSAGLVIFDCWIWKFGLSVNSPRKLLVWETFGWFLRKIFVRRVSCSMDHL